MNQLSRDHAYMLMKYTGMSLITGAISHGFFSGGRALLTAIVGICIFTLSIYLESKASGKEQFSIIAYGALLAIGIWAFTGGIQHFPDSPSRSVWIIPLGFLISGVFFAFLQNQKVAGKYQVYVLAASGICVVLSVATLLLLSGELTPHTH